MSDVFINLNLAEEPDNEKLAFILYNADKFFETFSWIDVDFDSIKICIDSPEHFRIFKREEPLEIADPVLEDEWDEDDEDSFFEADTCWEEDDESDTVSDCKVFNDENSCAPICSKWRN